MDTTVTDRIEKKVVLKAPIERVWRAISRPEEFGAWFGVDPAGAVFTPGKVANMKISEPPEYAGMDFTITIVTVEPPRLFSFRWHPYAIDPEVDYSDEPTTLIEFALEQRGNGTLLTVTESGFDAIPEERRATAFRMNEEGWGIQVEQVRKYVDG